MNVYISSDKQKIRESFSGHNLVHHLDDAEIAVLVGTDLGFILDLENVIKKPRQTFILRENIDLVNVVDGILDLFSLNYIERVDSVSDVLNRMEEINNGKTNNGKAYQLL